MIDIRLIRENGEEVRKALAKRGYKADFSRIKDADKKRREIIKKSEELKALRNKVSSDIPAIKKSGGDTMPLIEEMKSVGNMIKELDEQLAGLENEIEGFIVSLPNLPAEDVQAGTKENNIVLRSWGNKPEFDFELQDHMSLAVSLGLIDYERGVKLGGSGFWIYKGAGAKLEWALLNYFIEEHEKDGYEFMLLPHILNYECGFTAGQFPKFIDDVYSLKNEGSRNGMQFILPTAETALVNYHRDEILKEEQLPKKYFAYTPCYRKEAGSYRTEERGMIRGHQFNKVEMFQYTLAEDSEKAHMELVEKAERLVRGLGLHHRVSKLAAGDCSDSMAKTYDIEVWIPSMNDFKEVSSASNAHEYQARRGNIKVRRNSGRIEYLHTLNASGLATSRIVPAILEQYQMPDGSVTVPEILRDRFGADRLERIEA